MSPLMNVAELRQKLTDPDLLIVDCRHDLQDREVGRRAYAQGHVPGAIHVHLDEHLCGPKTGSNGRHPLPAADVLARTLGQLGVGPGVSVLAYDASGGMFAARLWWSLSWLGHSSVQVLDGGWAAWCALGAPVETISQPRQPASWLARPQPGWTVGVDEVLANLATRDNLLVDARAPARFAGQQETLDPVAGHIPGAVNRCFLDNLAEDGCFKSPDALRAEWLAVLGAWSARQGVHQCGSGVTACQNLLALEVAGLSGGRLYPGSWSEWCADASRPVQHGDGTC